MRYLVTTNSGEIWVMFLASMLALPVPLLPVEILWINLVTDGLPAIALGLEPVERDAMRRPPRSPPSRSSPGALAAGPVGGARHGGRLPGAARRRPRGCWPWQTMVFTTLALLQLGHALACGPSARASSRWVRAPTPSCSARRSAGWRSSSPSSTCRRSRDCSRPGRFGPAQLAVVLVASTAAFVAVEIEKWLGRRRRPFGDAAATPAEGPVATVPDGP